MIPPEPVAALASWVQEHQQDALSSSNFSPEETVCSVLGGVAAFGSTLALSTLCQQQVLRMSTGSPAPLPSLVGIATVCVASLASHTVGVQVDRYFHFQKYGRFPFERHTSTEDYLDLKLFQVRWETVHACCLGILAFKALGGRFWAISPSSYTHLGSFARPSQSLPATQSYCNKNQRIAIEKLGRQFGCHTCGSHQKRFLSPFKLPTTPKSVRFVGDHMPPKAVAEQANRSWWRRLFNRPVNFRFYPQCVDCSNKQGSILSKATNELRRTNNIFRKTSYLVGAGGGSQAHYHGFRFRVNHLCGGVVAAAATKTPTSALAVPSRNENPHSIDETHDHRNTVKHSNQNLSQSIKDGFRQGWQLVVDKL